jgi:hypothetical protein
MQIRRHAVPHSQTKALLFVIRASRIGLASPSQSTARKTYPEDALGSRALQ